MMGETDGLKPDGQTTSVGEEGDINKTSSPPHDFICGVETMMNWRAIISNNTDSGSSPQIF